MSTMVAPVAHRLVPTPAACVMSANRISPLLTYRRLETMLPLKKMSGSPSLSISPTATPAPLYTNTSVRSEEHTSELQSPCNLVCRLLLEKKKKKYITRVE